MLRFFIPNITYIGMDKKKMNSKNDNPIKCDDIIIVSSDNENGTKIDELSNSICDEQLSKSICDEQLSNSICDEQLSEITEPLYKNLVLSGGSIKGISHIGAIKKLIDEKLIDLKKIKSIAGASAGSIFGLLIALGFDIDEIWNFIYYLDVKNMVKPDFYSFLKKCGVESGCIIHNLIEEILTKKTGIKHINFRQLYELTKIHFIVVGSCLTTRKPIYYDYINTSNFKVSVAIRISIGIPGFFIPFTIGNNKYVDGGILDNYPMHLFNDRLHETIGILICNEYNTKYKYPEQYLMAIMNLFMYNYFEKTALQYKNNTIYVDKCINEIHMFSFDISNKNKIELFDNGVSAVEDFIRRKNSIDSENDS